jgi:hypothetical protein
MILLEVLMKGMSIQIVVIKSIKQDSIVQELERNCLMRCLYISNHQYNLSQLQLAEVIIGRIYII